MENKVLSNEVSADPLERKTKAVYELCPDFTFEFENGDTIQISKTVLAFHTEFLNDVFFGSTAATVFKVENFDSEAFKTFLDCLLGLMDYTVLDSLLIYPIAHQYEVKESLEKCVSVLKPRIIDENVSLTLNLALFYKDDELVENVVKFIRTETGTADFMENRVYLYLLEPVSMCKLIENMELNSFLWTLIYEWGVTYLEKQHKSVDVCSFFKEIGIFSKLELDHFESVQCIFDFHERTNMQLFDSIKLLWHLKDNMLNSEIKLSDKSEWVKVDDGSYTETIEFSHPVGFYRDEKETKHLSFDIRTNKIFFENFMQNKNPVVKVKSKYSFRSFSITVENVDLVKWYHHQHCPTGESNRKGNCHCCIPLKTSSFAYSEVQEAELNVFSDKLVFKIDVETLPRQFQEIKSVEIEYHFEKIHKSRILKTTLNGSFDNSDELYFTKNVIVSRT